ncbi:hypothetical protein CPT_Mater101 [Bacillus phage Mater]|uniref:Uncharacterized protein n=1 Tax=Bacillus phage Mater TaxID=1540090 RepID=A0A0A0RUL5_9CAUD|nr:hypothetical protein CPT_Mater101 [Bacillus phage Mater]AIW03258.1 hypothetical protein CPT_Mater101 [Bacillus phage Mater]
MLKWLLGLIPHECDYTEDKKIMQYDDITTITVSACKRCGDEIVFTRIGIKNKEEEVK